MKKEDIVKLFPIETDRLVIRVATLEDAALIQAAKDSLAPDILRRWMCWSNEEGMSMKGTLDYLTMTETSNRNIAFLALDKTSGGHVLNTGLDAEDDDFHTASTGWWLSAGHQGQGLAFEGMKAVIDVYQQSDIFRTLTANHYEGNDRSRHLMLHLGFQYVETKPKAHICHLDGRAMDVHEYRLEKKL